MTDESTSSTASFRPPARSAAEIMASEKKPAAGERLWISALAAIALLVALCGLFSDNGGLSMRWTPYLAVVVALGLPALASELRFWPKTVSAGFSALMLATTLSMLYAPVRSWFPPTLIIETGIFLVAGASSYLWRHRPKAVYGIFGAAALVWAYQAVASWLVVLDPSQARLLRPLGWHNPSAVFYGAFALIALSISLLSSSKLRSVLAGLGAGMGVAAVALTQSRGGEAVFVAAVVLLVVLARPSVRQLASSALFAVATAVPTYLIFKLIAPASKAGGATPESVFAAHATGHLNSATGDFSLRVAYWKTGLRMFEHFPIFGGGPGSWAEVSWRYMSSLEDPSTATHNWYIQTFAEQGVLAGLAVLAIVVACVLGALRLGRARWTKEAGSLEIATSPKLPFALGAAVSVLMLSAHLFIDFDNRWPVLMWLAAALAGVVAGSFTRPERGDLGRFILAVPMFLLAVLLSFGIYFGAQFSTLFGNPLGSNLSYNFPVVVALVSQDLAHTSQGKPAPKVGEAVQLIQAAQRWNPGDPRLDFLLKAVLFRSLEVTPAQLKAATLDQKDNPWISSYGWAANALSSHRYWQDSFDVAAAGIKVLDANPGWDTSGVTVSDLYSYQLQDNQAMHPCVASYQAPILAAQHKLLDYAPASVIADISNLRQQIVAACPNFTKDPSTAPYLK